MANDEPQVATDDGVEDVEAQLARVRSLSAQLRRAADQVVIGFVIGEEATAVAKRVERFERTGDDDADRATLTELEARIRRDLRDAKAKSKENGKRTTLGLAGIIIAGG